MAAVAPSPPMPSSDSPMTTPYASASSSPRAFLGNSPSAPGSPSRVPFLWEECPGTPKHHRANTDVPADAYDSAFEFRNGPPPPDTVTADELFHHGIIRPLKPPPRLQLPQPGATTFASSASPKSPKPRRDFDPFQKAMEETTRGRRMDGPGGGRRAARSLSPFRSVFGFRYGKTGTAGGGGDVAASGWRWKLKDLFLFRSKSEGRVAGNRNGDVLRKYGTDGPQMVSRVPAEEVRNSSFRSVDSSGSGASTRRMVVRDAGGSVGGSSRRSASAHELHYTTMRAVSQEQRKKTFLPYRRGLLDCLGFSPSFPIQELTKSFGSLSRNNGT